MNAQHVETLSIIGTDADDDDEVILPKVGFSWPVVGDGDDGEGWYWGDFRLPSSGSWLAVSQPKPFV